VNKIVVLVVILANVVNAVKTFVTVLEIVVKLVVIKLETVVKPVVHVIVNAVNLFVIVVADANVANAANVILLNVFALFGKSLLAI
jgi:hypothetical protein